MLRRPLAAFIVWTAALGIAACGIKGPLKPPSDKPAASGAPTVPTPESPPAGADNAKDKKQ